MEIAEAVLELLGVLGDVVVGWIEVLTRDRQPPQS